MTLKIAIVTWTTYNNYGTQLQAYALQKFLVGMGYDCTILSDEFIKCQQKKTLIRADITDSLLVKVKILLKRLLLAVRSIFKPDYYDLSQKRIVAFKKRFLIRDIIYNTEHLDDKYDLFICGSDQIWSTLNFHELYSTYYFLDFTNKNKISYAASLGTEYLPCEMQRDYKKLLSTFYAVSIREKYLVNELSSLINKKVEWVVDPTLLFDDAFWSNFCSKNKLKNKKYLLCYFLEKKKWYFHYAKELANYLNLEIVLIPNLKSFSKLEESYKNAVGPKEFVSLFKYANFVLTDSYHGSIFSIIFSRAFLCLKRFNDTDIENQNSRVYSLFDRLGITKLIIKEKVFQNTDIKKIDFNKVNAILSIFRNESIHFLKTNIEQINATIEK